MDSKHLDKTGITVEQCKATIKMLEARFEQERLRKIDAAHINLRAGSKSICTPQGLKAIFPGVRSFLPMRNPHLVDALGQSGADGYEARLTAGLK